MSIWSCWFGAKAKAPAGGRLLERDNLGTRYETHDRGPDQASAIAFLQAHPVSEPHFYLLVHTPEGVFGRDKDGIFDQPA